MDNGVGFCYLKNIFKEKIKKKQITIEARACAHLNR